jgi:hypothetical protein
MPIVARQSPRLPPSVWWFFWHGHGWFFDVQTIFTDLHNCSIFCQFYRLIIPTPATIMRARTLGACPRLERLPATRAIARNASRAHHLLIMIIAVGGIVRRIQTLPPLPPCLIIIIIQLSFYTLRVLTKSTPF